MATKSSVAADLCHVVSFFQGLAKRAEIEVAAGKAQKQLDAIKAKVEAL